MTWPPTCSQDVAETREDTTETDAAQRRREAAEELLHVRYCDAGWIGEDQDGHPRPCPVCHPGIGERLARSRGAMTP